MYDGGDGFCGGGGYGDSVLGDGGTDGGDGGAGSFGQGGKGQGEGVAAIPETGYVIT